VAGTELVEYSRAPDPRGRVRRRCRTLGKPGILVAGDAASIDPGRGVWLEGVNFDDGGGGAAAAAAAVLARREAGGLAGAHRPLLATAGRVPSCCRTTGGCRRAPGVVFSDFVQRVQPGLVCDVAESFFTVANPTAKPGLLRTIRHTMRARGIGTLAALRSAVATIRVFR